MTEPAGIGGQGADTDENSGAGQAEREPIRDTSSPGAAPEPWPGAAEALPPGSRGHSPAVAAGLSFLWPGLGQLVLGRRLAAALLSLPTLAVLVLGILQFRQGLIYFAASLWDESYFLAVAAAVGGFGAWRILAVGHAFMTASSGRRARPVEVAFVAALLISIVSMHGLFVAGAWAWYDTSVAAQDVDQFAVASPSSRPTPTPTPTPNPTPTPVDTGLFHPYASTGPSPEPTTEPSSNRITFLIVGIDFMTGRAHWLTDTMILVSIDTSTEKVAIVSVPRDTSNFDLYYGGWVGPTFKLNYLMTAAGSASFGSPDPPMKTLENEIGFLVGVRVDYYAAVDLEGFSKMIDAIGGVDVVNKRAINDPFTGTFVPAGPVHLDGPNALKYVRSREGAGDSDYTRAARQQDVLVAVQHKVTSPAVLPALPSLLSLAGQTVKTDFPMNTAKNYVAAATHVSATEQCVLGPPYSYHPASSTTGGTWTSRLDPTLVANLSVEMFGQDSRYYGQPGVVPTRCLK